MNLDSSIDIDIKGFLNWWGQELALFVPDKIRQWVTDDPPIILFSVAEQGFNVSVYDHSLQDAPMHQVYIDVNDKASYDQLLSQFPQLLKAVCILGLNAEQGLAKNLVLPDAAAENVEQVVGFELDRYTPFIAQQVYYAVTKPVKTGLGQIQVLLVLTPRPLLDELFAQLTTWEVNLQQVVFQPLLNIDVKLAAECNLLPAQFRTPPNRLAQWMPWLLNGLLLILFLAALIFPVWQERLAVDFLKTQLKALDKETQYVESRQKEMDDIIDETKRLIGVRTDTPDIADFLYELTHLLKDDTWVTNLQYSEKHLQIQGQSPTASALIGILEASPIFSHVSFVSPLTQDKSTGLERFQISMDVNQRPPVESHETSSPTEDNADEPAASDDTPTTNVEEPVALPANGERQ